MDFSSSNAPIIPSCINQAVSFLTRPLILSQSTAKLEEVRAILSIALSSCFNPEKDGRFTLSLSTTQLPPRPIFATCIATGVRWVEWMNLLGKRDFDLVIEPRRVSVTYFGLEPFTVVVWAEPILTQVKQFPLTRLNFDERQVPISKLGQQSVQASILRATADSARIRAQTRTIAQQLLESDHEEEAEEIFAMISRTAVWSPSPTREKFNLTVELPTHMHISTNSRSPLSPAEASPSPDSSRPSSPSSFSDYSFYSDDDESVTSASSAASFDFLASTKPAPKAITTPIKTFNRQSPVTFVQPPEQQQVATPVFVDTKKKEVTKYLYQGGVSTVLTGGVMLGASTPAAASKPKADQVPKYRAPISGRRFSPPAQNATTANSWRRGPRF